MSKRKGGFTLPGEAGYEKLTLELADKWGADVIRDSDGTVLSDEITNAGYGIYSTICIIRDHNAWAKENQDKLQQTFLMTLDLWMISLMNSSVLMTAKQLSNTGRYMIEQLTVLFRRISGATTAQITA